MKTIIFTLALTLMTSAYAEIKTTWDKSYERDGISVFKGKVEGKKVVAFKGIAIIDAPIVSVASVIVDTEHKAKWIHRVKEIYTAKTISKNEVIEYNRVSAPWPVSDRDFVYKAKFITSADKKSAVITVKSIEFDDIPKKSGAVRGEIVEGTYNLKSLGNKTQFEVEILIDPKGLIPKWIANIVQKKWPYKTIMGIRKRLKDEDFEVIKRAKVLFNQ